MATKKETENFNFWLSAPNTKKTDTLTPHKLSVVFLIQEYLQNKPPVEFRKKFALLLLKLIQSPDMPYASFHSLITSEQFAVHTDLLARFEELMERINSSEAGIEALFDLQNFVDKLMSETAPNNGGVSTYGIVGLYLRRIHVTLDKMSFSEVMALYRNVRTYYEKGTRALAISSQPESGGDVGVGGGEMKYKDRVVQCKWSLKQAELFVAQQSALLQNDETKALPPKEMQAKLSEIMQDNQLYAQAYFLAYLNSMRLRDYFNAVDALHRAFERGENRSYQFSSLNLAILHAQFGHEEEALRSLKECIMLAQENGDRNCLDLAQSWLSYLEQGRTKLVEANSKSELNVAHTASIGVQTNVKRSALAGLMPSKLFETLLRSDVLNCQHSMTGLIASCLAERAALWTLYGKNEIASLCSQLLLNSYIQRLGKPYNGEGICEALCCVALWLGLQGEYSLSAVVLQHARERFPRVPLAQNWLLCDAYLSSVQAAICGRWEEAHQACLKLVTLDVPLALLQRAALNIARGNIQLAQSLLDQLLARDHLDPRTKVRAAILRANAMMRGGGRPEVIDVLNEALIAAREKFLDYEAALVEVHFASVLLQMEMPQRALRAVKRGMESVLANGGEYERAKTTFLFVRCLLAATATPEERVEKMNECLPIVEETIAQFMHLECYTKVKDVYCFLAEFYHDAGMTEERNKFACKFRQLEEQFPTSSEYLNVFF